MNKNNIFFFLFSLVVLLFLTFTLNVFSQVEEIEELEIKLGSAYETEHSQVQVANKFKELVEDRSNGKIKVHVFPGASLGGEEALNEAISIGGVDMHSGGNNSITQYANDYLFIATPFVIDDWDHLERVWYGPIGQEIKDTVRKNGNIEFIGSFMRGQRHFTSNKPIVTPEDVKGLKLRLPNVDTWVAVWEELGAYPIPIAMHELYMALATDTVDASEGDLSQIWSLKLYEVQDYVSLTGHNIDFGHLMINAQLFDNLNEKTQQLIRQAGEDAAEWGNELVMSLERDLIEKLKAEGVTIIESDSMAFKLAARPAIERFFENRWTKITAENLYSQ
jgi:TRAP-type transport system periplasmic protein